jgi:hypothetical protein
LGSHLGNGLVVHPKGRPGDKKGGENYGWELVFEFLPHGEKKAKGVGMLDLGQNDKSRPAQKCNPALQRVLQLFFNPPGQR